MSIRSTIEHAPRARSARRRGTRRHSSESLTETAYHAIKEEIVSCRLAPGEPISIERFTGELRLSRTPVREAVLRLEKEGFIEIRPRMGTFVSHLELREIQEMYEVQRILESQAARLAAGSIPHGRLERIEIELRRYSDPADADLVAMSEAGERLHRLIVESCPNRLLAHMIESVHDHFRRFRSVSLQIREKVLSSNMEHQAIVQALKQGDGEQAGRLIDAHLEHAARFLLDTVLSRHNQGQIPRITVQFKR